MSPSRLALLAVAAALCTGTAVAAPVGGSVTAINALSNDAYVTNLAIVGDTATTDATIVSGRINNNNDAGWRLSVTSANTGKLIRTEGGGGGGAGREILYTNVKFVRTAGTIGAGLTDPHNQSKNIVTGASGGGVAGTTIFNTGAAVGTPGAATAATVDYDFALQISWGIDRTLLAGTYRDNITLLLENDN